MQRDEKSERSRRLILDTALKLFSTQGYRGTTMREIADAAGVSTGNVYHHFADKESIFRTLLEEYRQIVTGPRFPISRALTSGIFPDNLEHFGFAIRDTVRQFRAYMALHYVDVIEFDGSHIRDFYRGIAERFAELTAGNGEDRVKMRIRDGVPPTVALLVATRLFVQYFQMEVLFGVPDPQGRQSTQVVEEIADILRNGMAPEKKADRSVPEVP